MDTKECSKCGAIKPLDEFSKRAASKDGCRAQCRECCNKVEKIRLDKHRARKANEIVQYEARNIPGPTRKCPRCKENRPWHEYPEVTTRNEGWNMMCNKCRREARYARSKVAKRRINKKRLASKYRAKMKRDAEQWRAHMRASGLIWHGSIVEDAKLWREHVKEEGIRPARLQAEINSWPEPDKMLPH